eukprot:TRINITY_DN12834_c0_g1_i1.p1 TRINITY_DN12834_c0_g1~~TRINITY_DN12834_c0_g1_i1.p1  ORF type:complete len:538 (+),score=83.46 TRINITY_DN12834_c0_g1_i1:115-1614(+)
MTWFGNTPPKKKFHYCSGRGDFPGFPRDKGAAEPYFMNDSMTGADRYQKNINIDRSDQTWEQNEEKGIPPMPPNDSFGNRLIPRDEAEKFMPDIFIDGLLDEIDGDLLHMGKHIVPHQFHEFFDESLVAESIVGCGYRADNSRRRIWKQNHAMYLNRHPQAEEMQRKFLIGDERANDAFQDPDDIEYEKEIIQNLEKGDINQACSLYKRMSDPCKNWHIYTMMVQHFASRALLGDALAVYDEMEVSGIPVCFEFLSALVDCCIAAEHPLRTVWVLDLCHQPDTKTIKLAGDQLYELYSKSIRFLISNGDLVLASRLYAKIKDNKQIMSGADMAAEAKQKLSQARDLGILPTGSASVSSFRHRNAVVEAGEWWLAKGDADVTAVKPYKKQTVAPFTDAEISLLNQQLESDTTPMPYFKKSEPVYAAQKNVLREYPYEGIRSNPSARLPSFRPRDIMGKLHNPVNRFCFRWNGPQTRIVDKNGQTTKDTLWFDTHLSKATA